MDTCRLEARSGRIPEPLRETAGEVYMRIQRQRHADGSLSVTLLEDDGEPIVVVSGFLHYQAARDCSPNTLVAYAYDLRYLWIFLTRTRGPFWSRRPAWILWLAVLGTRTAATLIAVFGLFMTPLGWGWALFV